MIIVLKLSDMTKKAGKSNNDIAESTIQVFYNMFMDEETDPHILVKKSTEKSSSGYLSKINLNSAFWDMIKFTTSSISNADEESIKMLRNMTDVTFVQDLVISPFFGKFDDTKQKIINVFFEEYKKWRRDTFSSNIKEILPRVSFNFNRELSERFNKEFEQEKREIETQEFERICRVLEERYQDG